MRFVHDHSTSLYNRIEKLLVTLEWSDCSFLVMGKHFKSHKLILASSSPVFEAMLYGALATTDMIQITDIEPDVFQLMLNFIYTDSVELKSVEDAYRLLYVSRKYMLDHLTEKCVKFIVENINIDNVTVILNYPDFVQEKTLFKSALKLFCEHAKFLLQNEKNIITPQRMKNIVDCNHINIEEKELIAHVFDWAAQYCNQNEIPNTFESRRELLVNNGILKQLRFLALSLEDVNNLMKTENNVLLPCEKDNLLKTIRDTKKTDVQDTVRPFDSNHMPRTSLKLHTYICHRSPFVAVPPIIINGNNYTVIQRVKANKSIFIKSLCVPTRMAPVVNFRNNIAKAYSEQIFVSIIDEYDNSIIKSTNFMNTVKYDSNIEIDMTEPCLLRKDKWYKISFAWPQNMFMTYTYVVECRDDIYFCEYKSIMFMFKDVTSKGSFLIGLKFCL